MRRAAPLLALALLLPACSGGSGKSPSASGSPSASRGATPGASGSRTASPSPSRSLLQGAPKLTMLGRFAGAAYLTAPPGDSRLFVVELQGRIRVIRDGRGKPEPFLDIRDDVSLGGEQGLLSVAFAPDYATSGRFYVNYTDNDGDVRVVEFQVSKTDPDKADPATRRELLKIDKPYPNHNGGVVMFDRAGMLLVSTGDGGSGGDPGNRAQNLDSLLGKILRIDPRPSGGKPYGIPADNPFVGRSGARPEVWQYGLRNPWRFSIDPETGVLYLGDVGQGQYEEVNAVPPDRQAGANYGWRVFEGRSRFRSGQQVNDAGPLVTPVHVYEHESSRCAVTAGVVYRGSLAALQGQFLFADYCTGEVWAFPAGTAERPKVTKLPFKAGHTSSFGVDAAGEVYVLSQDGEVWRITA